MSVEQDGAIRASELALAQAEELFERIDVAGRGGVTAADFTEYLKQLYEAQPESESGLREALRVS